MYVDDIQFIFLYTIIVVHPIIKDSIGLIFKVI